MHPGLAARISPGVLKASVLLVLAFSLVAGGWFVLKQQERLGALQERTEAAEQLLAWERQRSKRFREQVQAVQQEYAPVIEELQNALKENPEWADSAVPGAVYDSLCSKGNCPE